MKFISEEAGYQLKKLEEENILLKRDIKRYRMRLEKFNDEEEDSQGLFIEKTKKADFFEKENLEIFRRVFEVNPAGILIVNKNGGIMMVNESACRLFGYSQLEFKSKNIDALVPRSVPNHTKLRNSYFDNPTKKSMGMGRDIYGRRRDGSVFPVEVGLGHFIVGEDAFAMASIIDLTYRKKLKESLSDTNRKLLEEQQGYEEMTKGIPALILKMYIEEQTIIDSYFGKLEQITGYNEEDFKKGIVLESLMAPAYLHRRGPIVKQAVKERTEFEIEYQILKKNNETTWILEKGKYLGFDKKNRPIIQSIFITITKEV